MEREHAKYQRLLDFCKALPPTPTAVAHPCDESSLRGAVEAAALGLIAPILVGPKSRIEAVAREHGIDIAGLPIVDSPYSEAAAARAVELVREGKAEALMKGSPHTDELMGAVLDGPLALDNAINLESVKIKRIESPVAGRANVLVVPDLEAGNMLAKSLSFLANADAAGIVLGARVPVILTSRADSVMTRLA